MLLQSLLASDMWNEFVKQLGHDLLVADIWSAGLMFVFPSLPNVVFLF